ncbi:hypothetical protein GOODEAATRI_000320 [Goodea atripinnis]|uniref:Uncharacterized protein n=1 Tax=Goodea atripinnis TaxID=208336 RepID=A0ABV0NR05_9TELE
MYGIPLAYGDFHGRELVNPFWRMPNTRGKVGVKSRGNGRSFNNTHAYLTGPGRFVVGLKVFVVLQQ